MQLHSYPPQEFLQEQPSQRQARSSLHSSISSQEFREKNIRSIDLRLTSPENILTLASERIEGQVLIFQKVYHIGTSQVSACLSPISGAKRDLNIKVPSHL